MPRPTRNTPNRTIAVLHELGQEALHYGLHVAINIRNGEAEPEDLDDAIKEVHAALSLARFAEDLDLDPVSDLIEELAAKAADPVSPPTGPATPTPAAPATRAAAAIG